MAPSEKPLAISFPDGSRPTASQPAAPYFRAIVSSSETGGSCGSTRGGTVIPVARVVSTGTEIRMTTHSASR